MTAQDFVPPNADLDTLRSAADTCRGCDLYRDATQTVFGAGPSDARVLVVGEQPGDQEDRKGEPFVGPAGRLLDRAMEEAGIDRDQVYVTNAVKHFKFTLPERGKRRIHKTPSRTEVVACRPWLDAELDTIGPDLVLCLGATAAKSLLGPSFRVTKERGTVVPLPEREPTRVVTTVHPSSVLRADDREAAYQELVADLAAAAGVLD
ncbi:UdgX family uracil-DNA binding protein [Actinophytocola gossypii]|uniref:Type-4 uracil-DNA glycosylase n=1 Tax=Actinophytocola gossypii TaxID=2812003 RepID=A0ABT2J7I4_9PSEU|nr:UdgX family uracil-DNA binding protein [Actinophytocola gossypii]MCT2583806.1 UdgX family uracil-DNA binding protein [Actinophytocola gossypii]